MTRQETKKQGIDLRELGLTRAPILVLGCVMAWETGTAYAGDSGRPVVLEYCALVGLDPTERMVELGAVGFRPVGFVACTAWRPEALALATVDGVSDRIRTEIAREEDYILAQARTEQFTQPRTAGRDRC